MFYVFLDIDGVLNSDKRIMGKAVNNENVKALAQSLEGFFDVKIILTSSWRTGFISTVNRKNTPQIIALEEKLSQYGLFIRASVNNEISQLDEAINEFLRFRPAPYIIIDDDISEYKLGSKQPHLYIVNHKTGLTPDDVKKLRKLIKQKHHQ